MDHYYWKPSQSLIWIERPVKYSIPKTILKTIQVFHNKFSFMHLRQIQENDYFWVPTGRTNIDQVYDKAIPFYRIRQSQRNVRLPSFPCLSPQSAELNAKDFIKNYKCVEPRIV